jgi:hypothetical protein
MYAHFGEILPEQQTRILEKSFPYEDSKWRNAPPPPKLNLNLSNIDGEIPNRVNVPIKKCRNSF